MSKRFSRSEMLLGPEAMEKLSSARVALFGLGGVGGYVLEALARGGIGALDLIDADTVSESNLNRQLLATEETLGMLKTDAAAARVRSIDPACRVRTYPVFFLPENSRDFDFSAYDYVVDAVDTVSAKIELVLRAKEAGVPIISCMGTGNKLDASRFEIADIYETSVCPLAKVMRKELRARGVGSLKVLYSKEEPLTPVCPDEELPEGKHRIPGSVSFVPSVAGLLIAGEVIRDLIAK